MAENQQQNQNDDSQVTIKLHYRTGLFKNENGDRNFFRLYNGKINNNNYLRPKNNMKNRNYRRGR